jgi:hypothetical protein
MVLTVLPELSNNSIQIMEPGMALLFGNPQFYSTSSSSHTISQLLGTAEEAHNI